MALEIFRLVGSVFVDTDKAEKSLKKTDKDAEGLGKRFISMVGTAAKFGAAVIGAATAAGGAMVALAENTREYRTEQGKLLTAFETSNFAADDARKTYEALNGVLGDSGQAVEASNHLAKLCSKSEDLSKWTNICTGVYATFGDSLPIEGLTEAANETAKTGALTGSLADALNWAGVAEDDFQKKLDKCRTEQERQALITETLNGLYAESAEHYKEVNGDVIAANIAQDKLNNTMAKIGGIVEPIITQGKEVIASVLEKATPYIEALALVVIPWLLGAISSAIDWFDAAVRKFKEFLDWLNSIGDYAGQTLAPIINDLSDAISFVKDALGPVITALEEYFASGQAAEDATNLLKDAIDFLTEAYTSIKEWIAAVGDAIQNVTAWMVEHEAQIGVTAFVLGTLTAAIIAYNAAEAIRQAGGIAGIAQMVAYEAGFMAMTIAETAHTVATNIATAATTAFGAAMAFLTSPITLVVLALGALIGVIALVVQNWDTVKAGAINAWNSIKAAFSGAGAWLGNVFSGAIAKIQSGWSGLTSWFKKLLDGVKSVFSTVASAVGNIFKKPINTIIGGINSFIRGLNKIKIPDWVPGVGGAGFSIKTLPLLYQGAVLEKGQVGVLEGNGAEAVVPLHNNKKWISAVAQDMQSAGIGGTSDAVQLLLEAFLAFVAALPAMLSDALDDKELAINQREFARLVKAVK